MFTIEKTAFQFLNIVLIVVFGLMHRILVKHVPGKVQSGADACTTFYLVSLLLWRREMFAAMSRYDLTNKFVGIMYDYRLTGTPDFYHDPADVENPDGYKAIGEKEV